MAPIIPIIVAVGSALIRTSAKQLPKLLRRFKDAKEIKNPSSSQVDKAEALTKNYTNFSKAQQKVLAKSDTANPSFFKRLSGLGRTKTQKAMKPDPALTTGEAKRQATLNKLKGRAEAAAVIGGGALIYNKLKPKDKPESKKKVSNVGKNPPKGRGMMRVSAKSGDSLSKIAKRAGITLTEIKRLNKTLPDFDKIKVGQKIIVRGN